MTDSVVKPTWQQRQASTTWLAKSQTRLYTDWQELFRAISVCFYSMQWLILSPKKLRKLSRLRQGLRQNCHGRDEMSGQRRVVVDREGNESFGKKTETLKYSIAFPWERVTHAPLRSMTPVTGAQCSAGRLKVSLIFPDYTQHGNDIHLQSV